MSSPANHQAKPVMLTYRLKNFAQLMEEETNHTKLQVTFSEAGGAVVGVASLSPLEMPPVIEDAYFCVSCISRLVDTLNMFECLPPM